MVFQERPPPSAAAFSQKPQPAAGVARLSYPAAPVPL